MAYTSADRHIDLIAALLTIAMCSGAHRAEATHGDSGYGNHVVDVWLDLRAAVSEEILKTDN